MNFFVHMHVAAFQNKLGILSHHESGLHIKDVAAWG